MRNNTYLRGLLQAFLENEFAGMQRPNKIEIAFGRRAKRRLGSIKMGRDKKVSRITINGIFRDEVRIPEEIIRATIAHELCHYAHGFCSPLPRKYKKPHQGGIVGRELRKRDLGMLEEFEKMWTKRHWPKIVEEEFGGVRSRRSSRLPIPARGVGRRKVLRKSKPSTQLERALRKFLRDYLV
jgi:hypothetical protein